MCDQQKLTEIRFQLEKHWQWGVMWWRQMLCVDQRVIVYNDKEQLADSIEYAMNQR